MIQRVFASRLLAVPDVMDGVLLWLTVVDTQDIYASLYRTHEFFYALDIDIPS